MKQIAFALTVLTASALAFSQQITSTEAAGPIAAVEERNPAEAADSTYVIFSNLGPPGADPYSMNTFAVVAVAGKSSSTDTEQWAAVRFSPKVDVQAKVLIAGVAYVSGTKLVNIGLYDNDEILNTVGTLLPGGQGSTTDIPDLDDCCPLAKVTLDGDGVTLFAGELYWLVISPDNINAPTFTGRWHFSNLTLSSVLAPPLSWGNHVGQWPAAEIRGTRLQPAGPDQTATNREIPLSGDKRSAGNVRIFSNLDRTSPLLYLYGIGSVVAGNNSSSSGEVWQALPFTPRKDVQAKTLAAAIGHISGEKKINLGLYSDNGGTVGTPLPGGQGSTTDIPESGVCCDLAKVTLSPPVALFAGVQYWLVASPDNTSAPDFFGEWQHSNLAVRAYKEPEFFIGWTNVSGEWLAAEIRGTNP